MNRERTKREIKKRTEEDVASTLIKDPKGIVVFDGREVYKKKRRKKGEGK